MTSIKDPEVLSIWKGAQSQKARTILLDQVQVNVPAPFPSPVDWRDPWMYLLMPDRFNNPLKTPKVAPFDCVLNDFQGGTFNGIKDKLPYLKSLGVGSIWITPVLKNVVYDSTYHGYAIQDFLTLDSRFASKPELVDQEFRALVDEAHKLGIYVIMDIVLNHVGNVFSYPGNGGDVAPFSDSAYTIAWHDENGQTRSDWAVVENINNLAPNATVCPTEIRKNAFFRRQGIPGAGGSDVIGDFYSYKQMMTANQNLQTVLIFCYQYMIAKFDIDGFRIDTLRYIDNGFERIFANAIREYTSLIGKKNFFMFGEDTAGEENISEFIGRDTINSLTGDPIGIDAVVDYPLYNILPMVCKGLRSPSSLSELFQERKVIEKSVMSTHGDATNYFITFLDNHDQFQRFYSSDSKDPNRYNDQVTLALACLFGLQGIPCLYYGTEQGLSGHGSRLENVREAMWGMTNPFNTSSPFYQSIQKIGAMRNNYPALRYGRQYFRPLSGDGVNFGISTLSPGVISFSRILADVEMVVVANTSTTESVTVFCLIDSSINAVGDVFDVVYSNKSTFSPPEPVQSNGSILSIKVTLQPMEVQVLA